MHSHIALTWLKGMLSRLSLNGSKLSRGSEDMASADLIMDISNALVASITEESWPDEGSRPASISVSLASRCDVGKELLVLGEVGESQYVTLCCVPGRVPTLGLKTLDAWASQVATGLNPSAWLPGFLLENSTNLMAAVRAADFLGCRLFQELMLEVQLLRVALGRNAAQTEADNQQVPLGSWSIPSLSSLSKAAFQQLPCVRQQPESAPLPTGGEPSTSTANDCSQRESVISAAEEVQAGDGNGSASTADEGTVTCGSTTASVPKQASVEEEWDELYGPVQPLDPEQVWDRGGQQLGANADEEGLRGGEQEPQQQVHVPVRHVTPVQMELLVEVLENSSLLQCLAASRSDVRSCLYRLGFYPALVTQEKHEKYMSNGKLPYLKLSLGALDDPGFGAIAAQYKVKAVTVFVESHDQGWSSYPDDHNTYRNSWTWAELVLWGPDGKPVHRDSPDRLYTNLHAVKRWQNHFKVLGPDSQLVQDLNARVFGPGAVILAAAPPSIGEQQQHPGSDDQQQLQQAQRKKGVEGVGDAVLVLLICACFPGWYHSVRQAEIVVHLSPIGMDGCVELPPRTVEFWEVRHRELMHDY